MKMLIEMGVGVLLAGLSFLALSTLQIVVQNSNYIEPHDPLELELLKSKPTVSDDSQYLLC